MFQACALGWATLAFLVPAGARGDMWTNAAGHAVEATLLSLDHNVAVFKRHDGVRFDMPLASLAPASRQRVLERFGRAEEVPERLRTAYGLCVRTVKRLDELRSAGQLGDEEYSKQKEAALARLEKACIQMEIPAADSARLLLLARSQ
jgi:hypothetical protein